MASLFSFLFKRKENLNPKKDENLFFYDRPFAKPETNDDVVFNLYSYLDFVLSYVKVEGNISLYPSYMYTYHLIQALKEINHPVLNNVLNRSIHWFLNKKVSINEINFNTYKTLCLFDFKHKIIQDYLKNTLSQMLQKHVNSRKEFHLQAFDGYLTSPMKQEEDSAITGANVLLKYHENLLIDDVYFDDDGKSRLLHLVEKSLSRARDQIWNRHIHRSYLYNMSSFLYTAIAHREMTSSYTFEQDINKIITELNFYQQRNTGLWDEDFFQSAYIFHNIVNVRYLLRNDSRVEMIFKNFFDNFLNNYNCSDMISKNVTHSNFLVMTTLLQSLCKILKNDDINNIVFKLREKKFEI